VLHGASMGTTNSALGQQKGTVGGGGPAGPAGDGPLAGCMPEERQQAK
jgi:hypothetical protein